MATVTPTTGASLVASAEATITSIQAQLQGVQAAAEAKIATTVAALQAHIQAHQAEVDAAQALIAKASPTSTAKATEAAAFVLTGASWMQGVVDFLGRNWRYGVLIGGAAVLVYAKFKLGLF